MTRIEAMNYLKAIANAFGPNEAVQFEQSTWSKIHASIVAVTEKSSATQEPVACCEKYHSLEFCPDCGSHIGADMRKALKEASNEANELALAVWDSLNRVACPEPFMRLAHDTVIKRYTHPQPKAEQEPVALDDAPSNSLPTWSECALIIENDEFCKRAEAGLEGQVLDTPRTTPKPTELHRFIHEYDDADPYKSAWFMHRLEQVLKEVANQQQKPKVQNEEQDKFCDNNCVWTDHHKDCVRAEKQEPKREPLTEDEIEAQKAEWFNLNSSPEIIFHRGVRAAEAAHGITKGQA